jgi:formylglycine-generating enzyme required for sulfatase activity
VKKYLSKPFYQIWQEPPTVSPPTKPWVPAQKSRRVSVVTVVGLAIAAVSALAAVIVIPEVRQWLGRDKPPAQRGTSAPVSPPGEITTRIGMKFVRIPAGEFQMGSNANEAYKDERPVHRVRISEPFYLGKYEVTQAQWEAVMGTNPSAFTGNPHRPVEQVSWEDVQEFITRLNTQEGWEVCRLPTEAQWEYAARAGTTTDRYENDVDAIAWYGGNSGKETHEVGQKRPNAWGVYDMLGNVREWCHDGTREYTAAAVVDPIGLIGAGAPRVFRGGSLYNPARNVRAANRGGSPPATATTPLASAVRLQAPASDERSETCRRRRRGAESVRHGWRSEGASGTLACIWGVAPVCLITSSAATS